MVLIGGVRPSVRPSVRSFVRSFVRATPTVTFLWFPPCACLLGFKISGLVPWLGGCDPFFGRGHPRAWNLVFWFVCVLYCCCGSYQIHCSYKCRSAQSRSIRKISKNRSVLPGSSKTKKIFQVAFLRSTFQIFQHWFFPWVTSTKEGIVRLWILLHQ